VEAAPCGVFVRTFLVHTFDELRESFHLPQHGLKSLQVHSVWLEPGGLRRPGKSAVGCHELEEMVNKLLLGEPSDQPLKRFPFERRAFSFLAKIAIEDFFRQPIFTGCLPSQAHTISRMAPGLR
jgi:hypothetical protein